ncbi:type II secretion system major pseudopilin GspG [Pseudorhodoferax sp.]|uniref:type II secretion system major pseudopilin GspG n=1 Tax=Pseudorhodoferax sp. TaxID=1993553 RepID=UPI002DD61A6B|nr:type II secretion system major pseudopilin GspG [Pseudorhodoferax sp.]
MKARRGFTLIELLVVIMIIGMLTTIVGPRLMGQLHRSESATARAQLDALDKALQAFRVDMGRYPTDSEGLRALVAAPATNDPRWKGPYLSNELPLDPWGSPYAYRARSAGMKDYDLFSLGRDRAPGGQGDDADVIR